MDCVICKNGKTKSGLVTVTLLRGAAVVVIKDVPAQICPNCGEYYLSEEISKKLLARANAAVSAGAEVEIIRFVA
ncbi:MAG: type II toxin-antitoxin system MqsA family antitoxin [Oligoflexales bacterium]